MSLGLVGRKVGMNRVFAEDGTAVPVTVLDVAGNRVTQIKTQETDGYTAVQVAYGSRRPSRVAKPHAGHHAKAGVEAGVMLKEFAVSRRGSGARRAVAALAKALRSGRAARRRGLAEIDSADLVAALPLWVGTLSDVEDILPPVAGMFDLVIIDEASHVDQPLAAPALLRGRSAVIGGDPRQLRHVSFVSDEAVRAAVDAEGTADLRDRLDVPKVSLFDAAAATAGVHWLDEHHRCAPHLIGFAAAKFYDGRIALLTTHPAIADVDCNIVMTDANAFVEIQGTAEGTPFSPATLEELLVLASIGLDSIFSEQERVLALGRG